MDCTISIDKLWAFLQSMSLSADNQRWLANRLIENSKKTESASAYTIKANTIDCPYTKEEVNRRLDIAEQQAAAGLSIDNDEVFRRLNAELEEDQLMDVIQ